MLQSWFWQMLNSIYSTCWSGRVTRLIDSVCLHLFHGAWLKVYLFFWHTHTHTHTPRVFVEVQFSTVLYRDLICLHVTKTPNVPWTNKNWQMEKKKHTELLVWHFSPVYGSNTFRGSNSHMISATCSYPCTCSQESKHEWFYWRGHSLFTVNYSLRL